MAPLRSLLSSAIAVATIFQSRTASAAVQTANMTQQCLLSFNLARTGKLKVRLPLLQVADNLATAAGTSIVTNNLAGANENNCAVAVNLRPVSEHVTGYMATFAHGQQFNCVQSVDEVLQAAIRGLGDYKAQNWNNGAAAPYNTMQIQNMAYLMFATATQVGCAATSNCAAGTNLVLCRFNPTLSSVFVQPPFTVEFFGALKQRMDSGITIGGMGQGDLNTSPPEDAKMPPSSAQGVWPAAFVVVVSVLGFASSQ